jgi:hypothetical protein
MAGNRPEASHGRPETHEARFAYAFAELADAQTALAVTHRIEHEVGHKLTRAMAVAVARDSLSLFRVTPAAVVRAIAE